MAKAWTGIRTCCVWHWLSDVLIRLCDKRSIGPSQGIAIDPQSERNTISLFSLDLRRTGIGIVLIGLGLRGIRAELAGNDTPLSTNKKPKNRTVWFILNLTLIVLSFWTGYQEMTLDNLRGMNPDAVFCLLLLVITPLFVLGALGVAATERFQKPSFSRFPLNWRGDPLQAIFVTTWCFLGLFVGNALHLGKAGRVGFWLMASSGSVFVGLLIGRLLAFYVYRHRIGDDA